jgi:hypothetical protein
LVSDQRSYLLPVNNPAVVDKGAYQDTGVNPRPIITSVNPTAGSVAGGATVTITGTNFTGASTVFFDGSAATSYTVNSNTQITAIAPAHAAGVVDISLSGPLGNTAVSASDHFTYVAPPGVTGISPTSGPATGGTSVVITGTGFTSATAVYFDGSATSTFTVNSDTQITAISPAGTGTVDVTVTTAGGTSAASSADQFTYVAAPTIAGLSPNTGPATGGTSVVITGTGFTGAIAVHFDGSAATSFTVNSDTQIAAVSPVGAGTVDVTVTTVGGTSATSSADQFTYRAITTTTLIDNGPNPSIIGEAVSFTATVSDNSGFIDQNAGSSINGETIFIEDASNANAVVAAPTLTNGSVTFSISDLSIGTHDLFAVYNGDATHMDSNSSATPVTQVVNNGPAPVVASIEINGGTPQYVDSNGASWSLAGQNSVVEQILVTFNEPVTLDPGAFSIANNAAGVTVVSGDGPNTLPVTANDPIPVGGGSEATQWIVTFSGPGTVSLAYGGVGAVIRDGLYILHTDGSKVHAYSQTAADNDTGFWAMYGAVHDNTISSTIGDGQSQVFIDCCDFNDFRYWLNNPAIDSTDPAYGATYFAYDYDLDGFVDADTFNRFRQKLNTMQEWVF